MKLAYVLIIVLYVYHVSSHGEHLPLLASHGQPTNEKLRLPRLGSLLASHGKPTNEAPVKLASYGKPTNEAPVKLAIYDEATNEKLRLPRMGAKAQQKKPTAERERELDKKLEIDKEREYRKLQQLRMLEEAEVGKDVAQVDAAEEAVNTATKRLKESFDRIHVIGLELSRARQDADKATRDVKLAQLQLDQHDMNKYKAKQKVDALYTELANIQVGEVKAFKGKKQASDGDLDKMEDDKSKEERSEAECGAVVKPGSVGLRWTPEESPRVEGETCRHVEGETKRLFNRLKNRDKEQHLENRAEWRRRDQPLVSFKRSNFPTTKQRRSESNFANNVIQGISSEDSGCKPPNIQSFVKHSTQRDVNRLETNRDKREAWDESQGQYKTVNEGLTNRDNRGAWYKTCHDGRADEAPKTPEEAKARSVQDTAEELLSDLDADWEDAYGKHDVLGFIPANVKPNKKSAGARANKKNIPPHNGYNMHTHLAGTHGKRQAFISNMADAVDPSNMADAVDHSNMAAYDTHGKRQAFISNMADAVQPHNAYDKRQVFTRESSGDPTSRFNAKMQDICLAEARVKMASMDVAKSQVDVKLARQSMQRQLEKLARLAAEERSLQRDAQVASQASREAQARLTDGDRKLYAARQKVSATLALETDLDKYLHFGGSKQ